MRSDYRSRTNGRKELETKILDFMEGKYDVLVSTTIVESGVDVPNTNTIFINDAQKLGWQICTKCAVELDEATEKRFVI